MKLTNIEQQSTPRPSQNRHGQPNMTDPLQRFLMELLEHYTLENEAKEAFPEWWKEMKEALTK